MLTLAEAAEATGGRVVGDPGAAFRRISPLRDAEPDDMAFLADRRYARELRSCRGRTLLVSEGLCSLKGGPFDRLAVKDPHAALVELLPLLHPEPETEAGVHPAATVDPTASLADGVFVGAGAVVEAEARVGKGARIGVNAVVGAGARIGAGTVLHPCATIYPGVVIGDRAIVHSGARIGVDGFGYVQSNGAHVKVPQAGDCVVEDDVEIGANCTIDRGSIGRTVIGAGSKLDNLVHVAHNVKIGPRSILAAQVGIAGSTRTGPGVSMGGQAGLIGHLKIGAEARIAAQAGVIGDVAPGETVSGYPAREHKRYLRAMALVMRLPELARRIGKVERRLAGGEGAAGVEDAAGRPARREAFPDGAA